MKKIRIFVVLSVFILLSACTSIPLGSMIKMVKLNPLDMDPQQMVVAIRTPQGIMVRDGDVVVNFNFRADDPDLSFHHQYPVLVNDEYIIPDSLKKDLRGNESITIMQLSEEDAFAMYNSQQVVKEYRQNDVSGAGNINVQLISACRDNHFAWGGSKLNVYLKTHDDESFFLLFRDMDVTALDDDVQSHVNTLPDCAETS